MGELLLDLFSPACLALVVLLFLALAARVAKCLKTKQQRGSGGGVCVWVYSGIGGISRFLN